MMNAPHFAYVAASYCISAAVVAGLVIDTLLRTGRWRRAAEAKDRNASR